MKELTIKEKAKAYNNALERAKEKYPICYSPALLEYIFPELKENKDKEIRKDIIRNLERYIKCMKDRYDAPSAKDFVKEIEKQIVWLEKQGDTNETINKDKFAQGVLKGAAINLITWIDYNAAEGNMCLSNMECKDVEDALVSGDWNKIYAYIKKKLEKQYEYNPYSGTSFKYNGHIWGMCARDGGVEILVDGEIKERVFLDNKPQDKYAQEATKEEKVDNQNCVKFADDVKPKIENEITIPFGAKDSELQEATYFIPKGFYAEIDDDKVVIKKGEKPAEWSEDDERIKKRLINLVNEIYNNTNYITFLEHKELLAWLEKLDDNVEL